VKIFYLFTAFTVRLPIQLFINELCQKMKARDKHETTLLVVNLVTGTDWSLLTPPNSSSCVTGDPSPRRLSPSYVNKLRFS